MPEPLEIKDIVENILSSYEARIEEVGSIVETTHQVLYDLQDSLLDTKEEREESNAQLRDILARNESLRRKDFDNMMNGILSSRDRRKEEVRNLLKNYFNEQKEIVKALRNNLGKFKDSLARGESGRVKEFQEISKGILNRQKERKEEVASKLKEFQKEQQETAKRLKELLAKGRELRIRDLKSMLKKFKAKY